MKMKFLIGVLALSILFIGCGDGDSGDNGASGSRVDDIQALTGDATEGQTLYASSCQGCHASDGTGQNGNPDITGSISDSDINIILTGPGQMPAFSSLTDQQIADIAAYVESL